MDTIIKNWLEYGFSNYGVLLTDEKVVTTNLFTFFDRESEIPGTRPTLTICLPRPPSTPSPGTTSTVPFTTTTPTTTPFIEGGDHRKCAHKTMIPEVVTLRNETRTCDTVRISFTYKISIIWDNKMSYNKDDLKSKGGVWNFHDIGGRFYLAGDQIFQGGVWILINEMYSPVFKKY